MNIGNRLQSSLSNYLITDHQERNYTQVVLKKVLINATMLLKSFKISLNTNLLVKIKYFQPSEL